MTPTDGLGSITHIFYCFEVPECFFFRDDTQRTFVLLCVNDKVFANGDTILLVISLFLLRINNSMMRTSQ